MKTKAFIFSVLLFTIVQKSWACAWYEPDEEYCNVFSQELINDLRYAPFLLSYNFAFYENAYSQQKVRNANIEEWQRYLGLDYNQTYYLVMKASRADVQALTKGNKADNRKLSFITSDFVRRHKQALLYLAYAKYLEPYMHIIRQSEGWSYDSEYNDKKEASELNYAKVINVLTRSWNAETDAELKLRYGYQLVRFAHYNRNYKEAVSFFDKYVEPLDYKPEMYYYALSQKAGALFGLEQTEQAINDFIHVFSFSKDLKKTAYSSIFHIHYDQKINIEKLLSSARTDKERNTIRFILGYNSFNNPLNELEKIAANAPDAIEAKVLMVRAINAIERDMLAHTYSYSLKTDDKRYPLLSEKETVDFLEASYETSAKITRSANEKDFWNLTTAYLCFLRKDFAQAGKFLAQVTTTDSTYARQKDVIAAHLHIAEQPEITPDIEQTIYANYRHYLKRENLSNSTFLNILANRYYIQKDYAKAFLINNTLSDIEYNLQKPLLDELAAFHKKKNKNELEKWLNNQINDDLFNIFYGTFYLTEGDIETANRYFQADRQGRIKVSGRIFGYNINEWYSGPEKEIMRDDYIADFPFIKEQMSEKDITSALLKLQKISSKNNNQAAKANFLIGNFFYNVTTTGYFRHYLRFDNDNSYTYEKYSCYNEEKGTNRYMNNEIDPKRTFYVDYTLCSYFRNTTDLADKYLQKALKQAKDDELKACILFALAKNELERSYGFVSMAKKTIPKSLKNYFDTLNQYKQTAFYKEARTYCKYFDNYVSK